MEIVTTCTICLNFERHGIFMRSLFVGFFMYHRIIGCLRKRMKVDVEVIILDRIWGCHITKLQRYREEPGRSNGRGTGFTAPYEPRSDFFKLEWTFCVLSQRKVPLVWDKDIRAAAHGHWQRWVKTLSPPSLHSDGVFCTTYGMNFQKIFKLLRSISWFHTDKLYLTRFFK
jgi:hypothetical protein